MMSHKVKEILLYSDSHCLELMFGLLHACILPLAMFELGEPWLLLQIGAVFAGVFQLYALLWRGCIHARKRAVQIACIVSVATVLNFSMAGMMKGSHLGWALVLVMNLWVLVRLTREAFQR